MNEYGMTIDFIDNKGRTIEIEIGDDWPPMLEARHNGKKIGHLEFVEYDDIALLENVKIEAAYQKSGIATQMFRELMELDSEIYVPNKRWCSSTGHEFYLSTEGAALVNSCMRLGILSSKNEAPY